MIRIVKSTRCALYTFNDCCNLSSFIYGLCAILLTGEEVYCDISSTIKKGRKNKKTVLWNGESILKDHF